MRPSTAATLALVLSASTAVQGASPPPEGGSIQALLNRYSARTHKAIPIDAIPKDLKANGTAAVGVVGDTTVLIVPVVPKNETTSVQNPKAATKIVKRTKAKKGDIVERLSFVVDSSSVVEEPSYTVLSPSPSVLAAAQEAIVILSSVPSELAAPVASSTEEAVSSTARAARKPYNPAMAKHGRRNHLSNDNRRRWIWSNSVIQDGDEDVPSESDNVALLTPGSTVDLKTPSATLSPPSYSASRAAKVAVESAHSARSSSKSSASTSQSLSVSAAARKAHSASKSSVSASKSSHTSASRSARSASKSASSAAEEESKAAKSSAATAARGQRTASKSASKSASSSAEESSSSSSKAAAARTARTSSSSSSSSSSKRSHRPPRTSTRSTSTTPSAADYRTPRTPKPTTSAASDDNPVVAQVAALQAQQKVHTTILASRINRAKARQQPTDVLLEEEDEGDVELSYYSAEDDEEEFDFEY